MKAMATTFHDDDGSAEVEVLGVPSSTGLVRVRALDGVVHVRHARYVRPSNEVARALLAASAAEEGVFRHCA